jgi:hypothetical protein
MAAKCIADRLWLYRASQLLKCHHRRRVPIHFGISTDGLSQAVVIVRKNGRERIQQARSQGSPVARGLAPFESVSRTLFVVAYDRDADGAGDFPKQEVVREAPQISPPPVSRFKVKALRMGCSPSDERVQFLPKLVAQPIIDAVVVTQNP